MEVEKFQIKSKHLESYNVLEKILLSAFDGESGGREFGAIIKV